MAWHCHYRAGSNTTGLFRLWNIRCPTQHRVGGSGWGNLNPAGDASVGGGAALGGSKSEVDMDFSAREDEYGYGE
jgi:hypothetical protein